MNFQPYAFRNIYNRSPKSLSNLFRVTTRTKHEISFFCIHHAERSTIILERMFEMANKKKNNNGSYNGFTTKFAVISLDSEGKEIAKHWLATHGKDLDTFFSEMLRDGWKTSIRWDDSNDCFIASSTQVDDDDKNHNVCVTSRSDNMYESILINYYKIYILNENRKLPTEAEKANWG